MLMWINTIKSKGIQHIDILSNEGSVSAIWKFSSKPPNWLKENQDKHFCKVLKLKDMFKWRFTSRWKMIFSYVSKSRTTTRSRGITCCLLKIFFRTKKCNSMFARDIIYRNMFDKKRICFLNNLLLVLLQEIWTKNTFMINVSFLWYKFVMASAVQKR